MLMYASLIPLAAVQGDVLLGVFLVVVFIGFVQLTQADNLPSPTAIPTSLSVVGLQCHGRAPCLILRPCFVNVAGSIVGCNSFLWLLSLGLALVVAYAIYCVRLPCFLRDVLSPPAGSWLLLARASPL
jgi:hypothetical protein